MKTYKTLFIKEDTIDSIEMTVPLFIRCLEWAHEDAKDDVEIHKFVENILKNKEKLLSTDDYNKFLPEAKETRAEWEARRAEIRKRADAAIAKLDAMPEPDEETKKKNEKTLASLLKNSKKYKELFGS